MLLNYASLADGFIQCKFRAELPAGLPADFRIRFVSSAMGTINWPYASIAAAFSHRISCIMYFLGIDFRGKKIKCTGVIGHRGFLNVISIFNRCHQYFDGAVSF